MRENSAKLLAFLILLFCLWSGSNLIFLGAFTWLLFVIWILPLLCYWTFIKKKDDRPFNPIILGIALFCSFLGNLGELHVLQYLGLALSLGAFIPWSFFNLIWLASSFFWMPASSWIASHFALHYLAYVPFFRLGIVLIISLVLVMKLKINFN
jgi:hypothetical protein